MSPAGRTFVAFFVGTLVAGCASDREAQRAALVAPVVACGDSSFPIYFESGQATLTAAALQALKYEASKAKNCAVSEVLVLGLADADGSAQRNMALSRARATQVASALAAEGLPAPTFDLEAAGAAGAVTPAGTPEPLRRRAEVVIRMGPA